ncbi:phage tail protein [Lacrimispora aerotolerans]|uniref:phage tail protein n=1 Tax=Lacrimispora aerotolerans TaxID=36832 RepID=UPI00047C7E20|nr:phage tail protein [Lacrimispora aerotolerans]
MCKADKGSCITINCGCCGNGNDNTPVGTIISFMGTSAPKHYLMCDGTIYNIDEYKEFSQYIKDQFGSFDYFGGDGTSTFAVPDLRGEFLRGTSTATRNSGTGAGVGVHQDATMPPLVLPYVSGGNTHLISRFDNSTTYNGFPSNVDKVINSTDKKLYESVQDVSITSKTATYSEVRYTVRPTNTAVLYCIKYE